MNVLTQTDEVLCPCCNKPLTLTELAPRRLQFDNCQCEEPGQRLIPDGAIATDLGGLWVVRQMRRTGAQEAGHPDV